MSKLKELNQSNFEKYLKSVCEMLTIEGNKKPFKTSKSLENRARELFAELLKSHGITIEIEPPAQDFPDIIIGKFGVEVKFTEKNTWRSVANSISEGSRDENVSQIYILFGKMGGEPEVRWAKYDDCVIHVRTSHVPRFEVEMTGRESLFSKIGISYIDFSTLPMEQKMIHVRSYVRGRIKPGEYYWWVESQEQKNDSHASVELYSNLTIERKKHLLSECLLLFPNLIGSTSISDNYQFSLFLLKNHNVLCPNTNCLFDLYNHAPTMDLTHMKSVIITLQNEIRLASHRIPNEVWANYWGQVIQPDDRVSAWLEKCDQIQKNLSLKSIFPIAG